MVTDLALLGKNEGMTDDEVREAFGMFGGRKLREADFIAVNHRLNVELEATKMQEQLIGKLRLDYRALWMEAVMNMLNDWGIKASIEYPGFVSISAPQFHNWSIGPSNDVIDPDFWSGELTDESGRSVACIQAKDATLTGLVRKLFFAMERHNEELRRNA
jgi:hypothetical protein